MRKKKIDIKLCKYCSLHFVETMQIEYLCYDCMIELKSEYKKSGLDCSFEDYAESAIMMRKLMNE